MDVACFKMPKLECPYCGHKNEPPADAEDQERKVFLCDNGSGGCDRFFVYQFEVTVISTTQKIEGE